MKKIMKVAALLAVIMVGLTGCLQTPMSTVTTTLKPDNTLITETTNVNNSDTHSWTVASSEHDKAEGKRIAKMTEEVMESEACNDCSDEGKAWASAFKTLAVAYGDNFKPSEFTLKKPTSGMDVLDNGIGVLGKVATVGIYGYSAVEVTKAVVDGNKGTTTFNGDATVDGSFNDTVTETHATTGKGNPTASQEVSTVGDTDILPEEETVEEVEEMSLIDKPVE